MDITGLLKSIEETGLAARIRESLLLFPLLEAAHVIGLALVLGTILVVDLRLLGAASTGRPFLRVASDTLKWTWAAFALSAITGALMFTSNASVYYHNFYFRGKMVLLVLAALNILAFELTAGRTASQWERDRSAPAMGKAVAIASLVIWVGVIFMGRMIGFTVTRQATVEPPPADVDFEDFLEGGFEEPDAPAPPPETK